MLHGNVLESLRKVSHSLDLGVTEFEIVDDDDERLELCDKRLPIAVRRVKS